MLVRMKKHITGSRNGIEWPEIGDTIELPEHEAADMISNGYVEEASNAEADPKAAEDGDEDADDTGAADAEAGDGDAEASPDGLDELDHAALIAYAEAHELDVNHRLGEKKLREAIRAAR